MMTQHAHRPAVQMLALWLVLFSLFPSPVGADDEPADQEDPLSYLWTCPAEQVRQQILKTSRLPGSDAVKSLADGPVLVWVERCFYGTDNVYSSDETRYAVLRVMVANRTESELVIRKDHIALQAGGKIYPSGENLDLLRNMPLQIDWHENGNVRPQSQLRIPGQVKIAPGQAAAFWCLFAGFDPVPALPQLQLQITPESGAPCSLDLNTQQETRLGLSMQRLGPRQALTVFTIHGQLNRINAPALARQISAIAEQGGTRFLVQWAPEAAASDDLLFTWLLESSRSTDQQNRLRVLLPSLPQVRQLLLADLPARNGDIGDWDGQGTSIFKTSPEAAVFALKEIYERVDPRIALEEIRTGHPWSKIAALEIAGRRLQPDALPELLELSRSTNPQIQQAAIVSLGSQTSSAAQNRLQELVLDSTPETSRSAFSALLLAMTPERRQLVVKLLQDERVKLSREDQFHLLADQYHPDWLPEIVKGIHDPRAEVRACALQVLHRVGHPQLNEFCREGLTDPDESVREHAFEILIDSPDREAEYAARSYALQRLQAGNMDDSLLNFVERVRETQAAPALIAALKNPGANRERLINVLGEIGTSHHLEQVVNQLDSLKEAEQMSVLQLASRMPVPIQLKLARQAVNSSQAAVIFASIEILKSIGSDEALTLLKEILQKQGTQESVDLACVALGEIGTRKAITILREFQAQAGAAGKNQHFDAAVQGLRVWRSRLPGFNFVESGYAHVHNDDDTGAMKAFSMAILINPDLADAYSARGNVFLRQSDFPKAGADFDKAYELDPFDGQAITGVAIVQAIEGRWESAIQLIKEKEPRFLRDRFFSYNTACVYSRCVAALRTSDVSNRDQLIATYEKQAIAKLKDSISNGFSDMAWMQKDPDLAPVRELPEFKQLISEE